VKKILLVLAFCLAYLLPFHGVTPATAATQQVIRFSLNSGCSSYKKSSYFLDVPGSVTNFACGITVRVSPSKTVRTAVLEVSNGGWQRELQMKTNRAGSALFSVPDCVGCGETLKYRIRVLASGSQKQKVSPTFSFRWLETLTTKPIPGVTPTPTPTTPQPTNPTPTTPQPTNPTVDPIASAKSLISTLYYQKSRLSGSALNSFIEQRNYPGLFQTGNAIWVEIAKERAAHGVWKDAVPRLDTVVPDPNWVLSAGTCHAAMTSPPAGITYAVTVDFREGSAISDTETYSATVHVTILGGVAYFYQDLCYWPFGNTVLLNRELAQTSIAEAFYQQTLIRVSLNCPNPMYAKVNQSISCLATRIGFTTNYLIEVTVTSQAGDIIWRVKT
jgi:hypothetical protein